MKRKERRAYEKRFRKMKERGLPSTAAIHRYLAPFHSPEEEKNRKEGTAFIPKPNEQLRSLAGLNNHLIVSIQKQSPSSIATLDQDATLSSTYKRNALYCYKGYKAYQPFNTYWAEHGIIVHSEFRDGNVNAGFEQLRVLKEALALLPSDVKQACLRSDSAGYQEDLIRYCAEGDDPRFGIIPFAIAAKVSAGIKKEAQSIDEKHWHPIYQEDADGNKIKANQEWADICFVPDWSVKSKANYRYLAIREAMSPSKTKEDEALTLPFQTMTSDKTTYKLFAVVTNRMDIEGSELIQWHRKRCGKSEQVHSAQKEELAGGQFPSNLFGVNAAWWQLMVLSFNLNRFMQIAALPQDFKESRMKALRFHIIQLPGRVIHHARQTYVRVERSCCELYQAIRKKIAHISSELKGYTLNSS
jgi:Transposase DDE domain group 1